MRHFDQPSEIVQSIIAGAVCPAVIPNSVFLTTLVCFRNQPAGLLISPANRFFVENPQTSYTEFSVDLIASSLVHTDSEPVRLTVVHIIVVLTPLRASVDHLQQHRLEDRLNNRLYTHVPVTSQSFVRLIPTMDPKNNNASIYRWVQVST
jgi:hypothetical protein